MMGIGEGEGYRRWKKMCDAYGASPEEGLPKSAFSNIMAKAPPDRVQGALTSLMEDAPPDEVQNLLTSLREAAKAQANYVPNAARWAAGCAAVGHPERGYTCGVVMPAAQRNLMVVLLQEFLDLGAIKRLLNALARVLEHLHGRGRPSRGGCGHP